jgi:hypothetical protein
LRSLPCELRQDHGSARERRLGPGGGRLHRLFACRPAVVRPRRTCHAHGQEANSDLERHTPAPHLEEDEKPARAFAGVAAIISPLGYGLMAEPSGSIEPLAQYLPFVGWGWGQQRRSSACAITACTVLNHALPKTTHNFNTGTRGFAAPEDVRTAVCVLPGTELAFAAATW